MPTASLTEITQLSVAERIQLVEDIWDTIVAHPEEVRLTDAQAQELEIRLTDYDRDPVSGASWREVRQRIGSDE